LYANGNEPQRKKETVLDSKAQAAGYYKIFLQEVWWEVVGCMNLSGDRDRYRAVVNAVMNLWVPQSAGNLLSN
jgi:hypothetical protein